MSSVNYLPNNPIYLIERIYQDGFRALKIALSEQGLQSAVAAIEREMKYKQERRAFNLDIVDYKVYKIDPSNRTEIPDYSKIPSAVSKHQVNCSCKLCGHRRQDSW